MIYRSAFFGLIFFLLDRALKYFFAFGPVVCNTGIAFGIDIPRWILFVFMGIFFIFAIILAKRSIKEMNHLEMTALSLIFFGGLSNGIDRVKYGCVIDYIRIIPYFPWFNIADAAICMGGFILIFTFFGKKQE